MESDSNNRKLYEVKLGSSPTESNLAVVSIDIHGSPGELNRYVLKSFGYDDSAPKELELNSGYALLQHESLNPILFIVTVGEDKSIVNLPKNLTNGLRVYKELFYGKTIWIPLMGMGAGELDITASFDITTDVLDTLFPEGAAEGLQFIISLPPTADGERLFGQINSSVESNTNTATFGTKTNSNTNLLEDNDARVY